MVYDFDKHNIRERDAAGNLIYAGYRMEVGRYWATIFWGWTAVFFYGLSSTAGLFAVVFGLGGKLEGHWPLMWSIIVILSIVAEAVRRVPAAWLWRNRAVKFGRDGTVMVTPDDQPIKAPLKWIPQGYGVERLANFQTRNMTDGWRGEMPKSFYIGSVLAHGPQSLIFIVEGILDNGGAAVLWYRLPDAETARAVVVGISKARDEITAARFS